MQELNIQLDFSGKTPLYLQLYRLLGNEILAGRAAPGTRLPSKRSLQQGLGVSQSTVENAYQLLCAEGYAESRARSGYYVSAAFPAELLPSGAPAPAAPRPPAQEACPLLDCGTGSVDPDLFPYAAWARLTRETLSSGPRLLERGDPQGEWDLRCALREMLWESRGVRCRPEQILVGAGQEYLLGQLLRLLPAGLTVGVEDPGYPVLGEALRRAGMEPLPLPVTGEGLDLAALEASPARAVYVTPAHQFPTGCSMPASARARLLSWAGTGRWILEDDYDGAFRYGRKPLPALQGLDRLGRVIYMTTFSRTIAPGFRLAVLVLPESLLEYLRRLGDRACTVSRLEQETLRRFLEEGMYYRHLRRSTALYRRKQQLLCSLLKQVPGLQVAGNEAGLHLTAALPGVPEEKLVEAAARRGVRVRGMSRYSRRFCPPSTVVIGYGHHSPETLARIGEALREGWSRLP